MQDATEQPDGYDTDEMNEELLNSQIQEFMQWNQSLGKRQRHSPQDSPKRTKINNHPSDEDDLKLNGDGYVPGGLGKVLRDYQVAGVNFLFGLYRQKCGGILADDMGLGKTVQSIAFLSAILNKAETSRCMLPKQKKKKQAPCVLVVTPASVMTQWINEMEKWGESFGGFSVVQYHGNEYTRTKAKTQILSGRAEVLLTSYETFRKDSDVLNSISWSAVLFDEVHRLKSPSSQTSKAAKQLACKRRFGLTGTVMQNKLEELWNLIDWASPGLLGPIEEMRNQYIHPIQWGQRVDASDVEIAIGRRASLKLAQKISKIVLRRDKGLIAHLLPTKIDRVVFCPLSEKQAQLYEKILDLPEFRLMVQYSNPCPCNSGFKSGKCHGAWTPDGVEVSSLLLGSISRLQKLANHPFLLLPNPNQTAEQQLKDQSFARKVMGDDFSRFLRKRPQDRQECSGKLQILHKLLPEWKSKQSKVLVFSKSTRMLDLLEEWLTSLGHSHLRYDGSIQVGQKRQRIIDQFSTDPSIFILLLSTGAGALGLNITAANVVVIFDPSWNASIDLQAQDRAFRMGQKKDCQIFRFISVGTIEEAQYQRQLYKQQMQNISLEGKQERRLFTGVQGVQGQEGELFGIANLLKQSASTASIIRRNQTLEDTWKETQKSLEVEASTDPEVEDDPAQALLFSRKTDEEWEKEMESIDQVINTDHSKLSAAEKAALGKKSRDEENQKIEELLKQGGVTYSHKNTDVIGESQFEKHKSESAVSSVYGEMVPKAAHEHDLTQVSQEEKEVAKKKKSEKAKSSLQSRLDRMLRQTGF